jgi:hypothetical protein
MAKCAGKHMARTFRGTLIHRTGKMCRFVEQVVSGEAVALL